MLITRKPIGLSERVCIGKFVGISVKHAVFSKVSCLTEHTEHIHKYTYTHTHHRSTHTLTHNSAVKHTYSYMIALINLQ